MTPTSEERAKRIVFRFFDQDGPLDGIIKEIRAAELESAKRMRLECAELLISTGSSDNAILAQAMLELPLMREP